MNFHRFFSSFATATARATGTPWAFILCLAVVLVWAVTGPLFGFSDTWQLVINTGTTIVTFLMVFLIQNTQNRDGAAIQTKLDELILSSDAENEFVGIEKLTEKELQAMHARCVKAAEAHTRMHQRLEQEIASRKGGRAKISNGAKSKPAPRAATAGRRRA
jgi:low affinity Fe/Cu permease